MKVGFIIGTLNFSGAEKIARHLINSLHNDYSHDIGIILFSNEYYEEFSYANQFTVVPKGNAFSRVLKRQNQVRAIVEKEKFDVVVSFGVKFNLDVMEALRNSKIPVILCERNDPYSDPHRKVLRLRRRLIYKKAAGFVFQTEKIAEFFGEKIRKRAVVIPNFIENKYEKADIENAENNIVFTGRLGEIQKNISMLLRAFNRFSKDNDYKLYIVGDGPDGDTYKKYVNDNNLSDRVIFTGKQNVLPYLQKAKIYAFPSYYEGMPNSLIEAMAVGLPCVATDCSGGGAAALIENGKNGILIPSNDEDAMVEALTRLANDAELRKALADEAYKINDTLEFNKIISMWVEYIEKVAKGEN